MIWIGLTEQKPYLSLIKMKTKQMNTGQSYQFHKL